jgi:hypothetical protein
VTSSMWVHNREAEGAGINLGRSWRTHRFPVRSELNQDSDYFSPMAVNTNVMSIHEEWKFQVKHRLKPQGPMA